MAATYLLADKKTEDLETTVFNSEEGDAVVVFTDRKHAQTYIRDAGWEDSIAIAELNEIQFIEWLIHCHNDGVKLMATNPRRKEQESGLRIDTLNIQAQLEHAGNHIFRTASPEF